MTAENPADPGRDNGFRLRRSPDPVGGVDHDPVRTKAAPADDRWPLRLQRSAGNRAVITLLRGVQRAVGWTGRGSAPVKGRNATETVEFDIRRFPVEDSSLGASGGNVNASPSDKTSQTADNKAVVLVPKAVKPDEDVQILLFFHGNNVGYRADASGQTRDVAPTLDRMEQQLQAGASTQLVGVLPQGTAGAGFGSITKDPAKYVQACLKLVAVPLGATLNQRGGIVAGGHSGGGVSVGEFAANEAKRGVGEDPGLRGIVVFDGINNFAKKDPTDPEGKRRLNVLSGDNLLAPYIQMCERRIDHDIAELAKPGAPPDYLDRAFVFRAYFQVGGFYDLVHRVLDDALKMMFGEKPPAALGRGVGIRVATRPGVSGLPPGLATRLRQNYQVIPVGAAGDRAKHDTKLKAGAMDTLGHDNMVGSGALQDALGNIHGAGRGTGLSPFPPPSPPPPPPVPSPHALLDAILEALGDAVTPDLRAQLSAAADALDVTPVPVGATAGRTLVGFPGTEQGAEPESAAIRRARLASESAVHVDPGDRPVLRAGARGHAVEELQGLLNTVGAQPPLTVDGRFGPMTGAAVGRFQTQAKLSPDRVVGRQTWGVLDGGAAEAGESTPAPGRTLERLDRGDGQATTEGGGGRQLIGFGGVPAPGVLPPAPAPTTRASDEVVAQALNFSRQDGQPKPRGGSFLRRDDVRVALANPATIPEIATLLAAVDPLVGALRGIPRVGLIALWTKLVLNVLERQFILDPTKSALDLLSPARAKHFKDFKWDKNDFPGAGPGEKAGPNEGEAAAMATEMSGVRPERRPNQGPAAVMTAGTATKEKQAFIKSHLAAVGGQGGALLYDEAASSFTEMAGRAAADGVTLEVLSSWRDPAVAAANAAKSGNANAVASFSSHSLGLAVDLKMSAGALQVAEMSTHPMQDVANERSSPAHKWMVLKGEESGWYPFGNEPWHWEYNPPGLDTRFFSRMPPKPRP